MENATARRMRLLKWALCAAFLSGMAVAPSVWTNDRAFPTLPVYPWVPDLPDPLCLGLSLTLVLSILAIAIHPAPGRLALVPPAVGAVLVVFDVNRMQPWFYGYALMFLALALMSWDAPDSRRSRAAWASCAAVVVGVYFWSGLQKLNAAFAHEVFPFLLHPLGSSLATRLGPLWPVAPIVETSVALLLLVPRTRAWGLGLAVAMHTLVLLALGPWGQNYDAIVWPWNLWTTIIAFVLFFRHDAPLLRDAWAAPIGQAIVVLVGVLPALNFVDRWDGFLSASFYSGKLRDGWIYLTADGVRHLPPVYVRGNRGLVRETPNRFRLDVLGWAMWGMNAPPYGEPRFYPGLLRRLERDGVPPESMLLMVQDRSSLTESRHTYSVVPTR